MLALLDRHGASGPHAVTVLLCEAGAGMHGSDSRGTVELSWSEFARFAGIGPEHAQERLHELTAEPFTLIEIEHETTLGFRARFPRWAEWDKSPKDPTGAKRQRAHRARTSLADLDERLDRDKP